MQSSGIRTGNLQNTPESLSSCQYQALLECMQRTGNNEILCEKEIQDFQNSCRPRPSKAKKQEKN